MEIGTEISQKIRSAIKAKLIEQGAYVDDELPDYIMVMVANKKTQKQMTDDLSLFLGNNTEKFTSWLHGLLKKLQSINTDDGSKHKSKHKEHKGDKKKHKTTQGEKEKIQKTSEGEKVRKSSTGEKEKVEKKKNEEKTEAITVKSKPATQHLTSDDVPEIKISEDTDEFNEENREAEMKEQKKTSSTGKPPPTKVAKSDKSGDVKKSGTKIPTKESASGSSSVKLKSTSSTSSQKSECKEVRKKPSSFVANVKRKYEEIDEDEEYDPANPAVGSVASVVKGPTRKSSVPKALQANKSLLMKAVTEAEKSVTTSKKADLLTEASEPSMRSDRKPVDLKHRLKTAAGLGLISRSKRTELEGMKYTVANEQGKSEPKKPRRSSEGFENIRYTIQNESVVREKSPQKKVSPKTKAPPVPPARVAVSAFKEIGQTSKTVMKKEEPLSDDEKSEEYGPPLPDTRLVQRTTVDGNSSDSNPRDSPVEEISEDNVTPDPEIQQLLDEAHETLDLNDDLMYEADSTRQIVSGSKSPTPEPRFIVTLDGVNPQYSALPRKHPVQTVKPVPKQITAPEKQQQPPRDQGVVMSEATEQIYTKIAPPKIKPFNINLKDSDDEDEGEEMDTTETDTQLGKQVISERCRFWPACAKGNKCQYIHPSIPCKTFPLCKFGDKCMYLHPNCRFDAKCMRMDCPYTHSCKRKGLITPTVIQKIVQVPMQPYMPQYEYQPPMSQSMQCKYFPNCRNMSCPFTHPKPCRYGIGCMNKSSCLFHHPPLPGKDKLKWSPAADKTEASSSKKAASQGGTEKTP